MWKEGLEDMRNSDVIAIERETREVGATVVQAGLRPIALGFISGRD